MYHSFLLLIFCLCFGGVCGGGLLRLFIDALGHSHLASGHTDCTFLFFYVL